MRISEFRCGGWSDSCDGKRVAGDDVVAEFLVNAFADVWVRLLPCEAYLTNTLRRFSEGVRCVKRLWLAWEPRPCEG